MHIPGQFTRRRRGRQSRPVMDQLDDRCLLSGLTPQQLTNAYGLNAINFSSGSGTVKGNGAGETIALIEAYHDPSIASDLTTFDQAFGLSNPSLTVVNQGNGTSNPGWGLEESLDVEWAHAIAPGANILVVEAASQSRQSLLNAVNTARSTPGVVAVSMSWGFNEFAHESAENSVFTTPPGHVGITFLAASGDSGAAGGAEWPSVAPEVLAVGGTTLLTSRFGGYLDELAWIDSSGGYSHYQAEPGYQRTVQQTGKRSTPDVAFDGDPQTGVQVYETSPYSGYGGWQTVGGTSLGTPAWAAIIAIVDQGRSLEGKGSLDGATQTLPSLYSISSVDYNAVTQIAHHREKLAVATANTVTGLGSPVAPLLVADLVASNIATPLSTSGSVGITATRAAHSRIKKIVKIAGLDAVPQHLRARPAVHVLKAHTTRRP
jgi:subtilase family serine protease